MFELSFSELLLVIVVGLLVFGPDKLPQAARSAGLFVGRLKRSYQGVRREMERELGMDEIKRQLHNEEILRSLGETPEQLKRSAAEVTQSLQATGDEIKQAVERAPAANSATSAPANPAATPASINEKP